MKRECFFWTRVRWLAVLVSLFVIEITASATTLTRETATAWESYVQAVHSRMRERLRPGHPFISINEGMAETIRAGQPLIFPFGRTPQRIPLGLIHDWVGISFIPNARIDEVLSTVRDYTHYAEFYRPAVAESKEFKNDGSKDRFSILLINKSLVVKTALDADYESSYTRVDDHRWYSTSEATRIQEIENYGTPEQHRLPQDEGTGLIWRLRSMMFLEERDGGVYIEVEAIALSRDIPMSLRWIAAPVVRSVSKHSLLISLQQTRQAVNSRKSRVLEVYTDERNAATGKRNSGASGGVASFR